LVNCDGTGVVACSINTRTRYSVCVRTGINDGVFALMKKLPCSQCRIAPLSLPLPEEAAADTPADEGGGA
jgi:hypothetical protein